jgi:hypothetical protein
MVMSPRSLLALGLLAATACSSDPSVAPPVGTPKDGGVSSGMDATTNPGMDASTNPGMDASTNPGMDASMGNPDATVNPPVCDPTTGTGCPMGQVCDFSPGNGPRCVMPAAAPVQPGAACRVAMNECPVGFSCLADQGQPNGVCAKICGLGGMQCAQFMDANGNPLICSDEVLDRASGYGVCAADLMECVPFNDMCPAGQYCEIVSTAGTGGCVPLAMMPAAIGQPCQPGTCARGGICLNLGGGATCQPACDPANGMGCAMNQACTPIGGPNGMPLPFGVCQATAACTPLMDTCPMGQMCQPVSQTAFGCGPAGMRMTGQSCGGANGQCMRGDLCAGMQGGGATCLRACDAGSMCPAGTMCNTMAIPGATFGLCL